MATPKHRHRSEPRSRPIRHALTIDVEDYYNVFARDRLGVDEPPSPAVVANTGRLLEWLEACGVRATFFVLGEVAETYPDLVGRIAAAGHEVGVHGYAHRQVFRTDPETFRDATDRSRRLVGEAAGRPVEGYRAPAFSIRPDTAWALDVLADLGFRYDSSVFPMQNRRYGWRGFPMHIHEMALAEGGTLIEAPAAVVEVPGVRLPCCGGGYLRHFPYAYTRWAMRRIGRRRPAIVYAHPYDIDLAPPPPDFTARLAEGPTAARRHHAGQLRKRDTMERKLKRLLSEFTFAPLGEVIDETLGR